MDPETQAALGSTAEQGGNFTQKPLIVFPIIKGHHTSFQMAGYLQVSLPSGKKLGGSHISLLPRAVTTSIWSYY